MSSFARSGQIVLRRVHLAAHPKSVSEYEIFTKRPLTAVGHRFFSETPLVADSRTVLSGDEGRHLATVMRGQVGDEVVLFDGLGAEFQAAITRIGRSETELQVLARVDVDRELTFRLVLGVALPRGDRQRWLVEKAVELGVTMLVPLVTERGVAQPTDDACRRLRRSVIEASKQCGRNRLMEIETPRTACDYLAGVASTAEKWFAHPAGDDIPVTALGRPRRGGETVALAIGPEGGFSAPEAERASAFDWHRVSLGRRILRIETAAITLCARVTTGT